LNEDYYDIHGRPKYDEIINYENQLRQEMENKYPLVSDKHSMDFLVAEFKESIFENAINVKK
jgi:hypothetical protein